MKYSILIAVVAFLALTYSQTIGPGEPDSRCPPNAPVNPPFHISHPTNCSLFMTCIGGNAFPQACPSGQHWASSLNRCDWPDVAQCEEGVGNDCPPGSPNPPVFLPHPTDCSRFFQCANGRPVEISCPPGQEWSQENGWCDWPE